jgi:hypothetical protein
MSKYTKPNSIGRSHRAAKEKKIEERRQDDFLGGAYRVLKIAQILHWIYYVIFKPLIEHHMSL